MELYYADGNRKIGPISRDQLQDLINAKKVTARTLVWRPGMDGWQELGKFAKRRTPPPADAPPAAAAARVEQACVECGQTFAVDDMIPFKDNYVCAGCKPTFVQKMKEGVTVAGQMTYAGFWIRTAAIFIDGLILGALNLLVNVPFGLMAPMTEENPMALMAYMPVMMLLQLAIPAGYDIFFVGRYGATPGKMACRIKIVAPEGERVTYPRAIGRHFAKYVSMITLYIGFLMAAFDDQKRTLHDRICDTRVVRKD